jgi:hypothetical protein
MHPPFYTVDHKIGPDIHHLSDSKPVKRRSQPEQLQLTPATIGWPPVPLLPNALDDLWGLQVPSGSAVMIPPKLRVVPPPQRTWRDVVGRLLIRAGQRMILENRASGN